VLQFSQNRFPDRPCAFLSQDDAAIRRTWAVTLSFLGAHVFSIRSGCQSAKRTGACGERLKPAQCWWLEPEVGMQLDIADRSTVDRTATELQLARLIAGVLGAAQAGGHFNQLIVMASEEARRHLLSYLGQSVRACIAAEMDLFPNKENEAVERFLHAFVPVAQRAHTAETSAFSSKGHRLDEVPRLHGRFETELTL
jgi:hypothetical protein